MSRSTISTDSGERLNEQKHDQHVQNLRDVPRCGNSAALSDGNGGSFTWDEFLLVCAVYGNRCLKCGFTGKLSPDHVTPLFRGGSNNIDNIQPLCITCNKNR